MALRLEEYVVFSALCVFETDNGVETVQWVRKHLPGLIVLDISILLSHSIKLTKAGGVKDKVQATLEIDPAF